jgi:hypothetical protein
VLREDPLLNDRRDELDRRCIAARSEFGGGGGERKPVLAAGLVLQHRIREECDGKGPRNCALQPSSRACGPFDIAQSLDGAGIVREERHEPLIGGRRVSSSGFHTR